LEKHNCDGCPTVGTGRLPGGLAWLASYLAFQFAIVLVLSGVQVLRGYRSPAIAIWTIVSASALALLVLGTVATFDGSSRAGAWLMFLACPVAIVGHTRLFDRFDPPPLIEAPPPPMPIERLERKTSTIVRAADVGQAGLRITTDEGVTRLAWEDILRVQLISGLEPGVELSTRGANLRINRKSNIDYRFLPGPTDGTAADNMRRLYEFVREKNPALRVTL
jgi:hypothetical protein